MDALGPEKLLLRWVNYHLARAGYGKPISNFGSDIKDSKAYLHLLSQIQPDEFDPRLHPNVTVRINRFLSFFEKMEDISVKTRKTTKKKHILMSISVIVRH